LGCAVSCRSCGSTNQRQFGSEINIHLPGENGREKPTVMVFPTLVVCLECGFAEFSIPEAELHQLKEDGAGSAAA